MSKNFNSRMLMFETYDLCVFKYNFIKMSHTIKKRVAFVEYI